MGTKLTLKGKIILGSIAIAIFVSLTLMVVNSFIIKNQNTDASHEILKNAFLIVTDDLGTRQEKLIGHAAQLAQRKKTRDSIPFLKGYKSKADTATGWLTADTYSTLTEAAYNIGNSAKASKIVIYDMDGDLMAFATLDNGKHTRGYAHGFPTPVYKIKTGSSKDNANTEEDDSSAKEFVEKGKFEGVDIALTGKLPTRPQIAFKADGGSLTLQAYAPIFSNSINRKTGELEDIQSGVVLAVHKLDQSFVYRLARLTNTQINLFIGETLSVGTLTQYKKFDLKNSAAQNAKPGQESLDLNDVTVDKKEYYQGVFPLMANGKTIGVISAVHSKSVVKARTWQSIGLLALFSLGCLLLIVPIAIIYAAKLSKPISNIIQGLSAGAISVAGSSSQVSASSQALASGASEQAATIEETSSSLEEMATVTRTNAENARMANQHMDETKQLVDTSNDSMNKMEQSMADISATSQETSKIIKTIDEIAFQTNLLALNAAVEAARAGEAGAGFAVVADEVRNLALRAAEAAKNTSTMIEETEKKVAEGATMMTQTNQDFDQVSEYVGKIGVLISEISKTTSEQAEGINQINHAVEEMSSVTQQTAGTAEESSGAAGAMNTQAEQMKTLVIQLTKLVKGNGRKKKQKQIEKPNVARRALAAAVPLKKIARKKIQPAPQPVLRRPPGFDAPDNHQGFEDF
jgi:hypothetical protein